MAREFVDEAIQEKLEREEDAMSLEERVDRIEDKLDRISSSFLVEPLR